MIRIGRFDCTPTTTPASNGEALVSGVVWVNATRCKQTFVTTAEVAAEIRRGTHFAFRVGTDGRRVLIAVGREDVAAVRELLAAGGDVSHLGHVRQIAEGR